MVLLDGSRETLVLLGIVVLQSNLQFHSFLELALLVLTVLQNGSNSLDQGILGYFTVLKKL